MKKTILFAFIGAALCVSCQKENFETPKTVISVGIDAVKTTIGDSESGKRKIYWANGDLIRANAFVSDTLKGLEPQQTSATFTFQGIVEAPVNFLYPASYYKDASTVTLPAVQTPKVATLPMCGYSATLAGSSMKVFTTAVQISLLKGTDTDMIRYIELSSDTQPLSGDFTIDYQNGTISSSAAAADNKILITVNGELSSEDSTVFVASIPAGSYNLTVKVKDVNAHCMTKTLTGKTFTAGNYVTLPKLTFTPTTTEFDINITTSAEWNAFATGFNEGKYHEAPLVKIANDIDFDGVTPVLVGNYRDGDYCNAIVEGNNHSFLNLTSSNPLIAAIDPNGCVRNLTLASSCTFTPDLNNSRQNHFGPFAEYVKGTIENCTNNGSISYNPSSAVVFGSNNYVGGIAGRVREGKVANCTNNGAITLGANYTVSATAKKALVIGGIVGWMSNVDGELDNCSNNGTITTASTADPFNIGGIAGQSNGKISNCTNNAILSVSTVRATSDPCKNINLGGIVGNQTDGVVSSCSNTDSLKTSSTVKLQSVGGIAGTVAGGSISGNTNSGDIVSTAGVRQLFAGGIIGTLSNAGTYTFTGTPATGTINVSSPESGTSAYLHLGGLVGRIPSAKGTVIIKGDNLDSFCDISFNVGAAHQLANAGFGGIIGSVIYSEGDIPSVEIDSCKVKGNGVKVTMTANTTFKPVSLGMGGILGYSNVGIKIANCTVAAVVNYTGSMANSKDYITDCGGIVGRVVGGDSEITNCSVTTTTNGVCNKHYNNNVVGATTGNGTGGIIGSFGHVSGNTSKLTITNCTSSADIYAYRCCGGGIAGFLDNATVKGCSVTGAISNANYAGGLVGYASNCTFGSATATDACTFNCATGIVSTSAGSCKNYAGGLAGQTAKCKFTNCGSYFGTGNGVNAAGAAGSGVAPGALIGYSDANTTVASCKAGGKLQSKNYGMPGAATVKTATLDATTVLTYAVGNKGFTPTAGSVTLWDGQ